MFRKKDEEPIIFVEKQTQNENELTESEDIKTDSSEPKAENKSSKRKNKVKGEKKPKKEKKIKENKSGSVPFWQNKKAVGILLICFAVAMLIVSPLLSFLFGQTKVTVYVANEAIEKTIAPFTDRDKIKAIEINKSALLPIYITSEEDIIGSYVTHNIAKGEIISKVKVSKEITKENSFSYQLEGKKALAVTTKNLASSVAAEIKPGDIVSAYIYDDNNSTDFRATLIPECAYVKVLSVSDGDGNKIIESQSSDSQGRRSIPLAVTLLVNDTQASALVGADENFNIYFAICSRNDAVKEKELLELQEKLFEENGEEVDTIE